MSKANDGPENNDSIGPVLPCPFCGEREYLRNHLGECNQRPDSRDMTLDDYAEGSE